MHFIGQHAHGLSAVRTDGVVVRTRTHQMQCPDDILYPCRFPLADKCQYDLANQRLNFLPIRFTDLLFLQSGAFRRAMAALYHIPGMALLRTAGHKKTRHWRVKQFGVKSVSLLHRPAVAHRTLSLVKKIIFCNQVALSDAATRQINSVPFAGRKIKKPAIFPQRAEQKRVHNYG